MRAVTVEVAKTQLEALMVDARRGNDVLIVDDSGEPAVRLSKEPAILANEAPNANHQSLIGMMKGQVHLLPGWDEPLADFAPCSE